MPNIFALAYLVMILIRPHEYVEALDGLPILPTLLACATATWLLSNRPKAEAPQVWLVPALLGAMVLSMVGIGYFQGMMNTIEYFLPIWMLFILLARSFNNTDQLKFALKLIGVCAIVLAIHGIQQANTGMGWTGLEMEAGRILYLGFHNDPNDLGLFFLMSLPMILILMKESSWFLGKLFWLSAAGTVLYGIYLTNSRGAILSTAVLFGLWVRQRFGNFVAVTMGVLGFPVLLLLPSRMSELEVGESSAFGRVSSWYEGLQMFIGRPFTGVGHGLYTDYHYLTAHNSLVLVLAELGFVGFVVWISIIGYSLLMMRRVMNYAGAQGEEVSAQAQLGTQTDRRIAGALMYSIIGFFVAGFFLSRGYYPILYAVVGLVVAHYINVRHQSGGELPVYSFGNDWMKWTFYGLIGVIGLFVIVKGLHLVA